MGVYLPTAAVGNGRILATIGASGELMGLFWPRLDFAQNVHECMPAIYIGHPGQGSFRWTWQADGQRSQVYIADTNILTTVVDFHGLGVRLTFTDFCPPDEPAFVRRVRIENMAPHKLIGAFMHYFELWLGEVQWKQGVHLERDYGCILQYFRDWAAAVGGTAPDLWRCGKWTREDEGSAKVDMYDGHLSGQPEDIGQVNFALGWNLDLASGETREVAIIIALASSREAAAELVVRLSTLGPDQLQQACAEGNTRWLARAREVTVPEGLATAYRRALLSLRMLCDDSSGAIVAAPEFDPGYEMCGGYGYCWPRDAAQAAFALQAAGYPEFLTRLAVWLAAVQMPGGVWGQRYWCDGQVASSWALRDDFLQLDESGAAVLVLCAALQQQIRAGQKREAMAEGLWNAAKAGAVALANRLDASGYHTPACDLWETSEGVFAYTQAAVAAALATSARLACEMEEVALAQRLQAAAGLARRAALSLYGGGYFARGRRDGRLDPTADSSVLGLVEPFGILDLSVPEERTMAESTLLVIEKRLGYDYPDGRGIMRYEGDTYLGGVVGAVNTLWAALVCYRLAETADDPSETERYVKRAEEYLASVLARTTPAGLLPELVPSRAGVPYWAAPHAWASALLVNCVLAASRVAARTNQAAPGN